MTAGIDGSPYQHGDLVTVADVDWIVDEHQGDQVTVCSEDGSVGFTVHQDEVHERLVLDEGGDLIEYATATFNAARTHRYQLSRIWDRDRPPIVIAGWGVPGQLAGRDREVCSLLAERGIELKCLGRNKDGSPKHPLYVRATQPLEPYRLEIHA